MSNSLNDNFIRDAEMRLSNWHHKGAEHTLNPNTVRQ